MKDGHICIMRLKARVPGVCNDDPTRHDPVPDVCKAVMCFDYVQGGTMKTEVVVFKVLTHHHIVMVSTMYIYMIKLVRDLCDA